jgi:hypothetical protein
MKQLFMIAFLGAFTFQLLAQDTTIYRPNFILDIVKKDNMESHHYEKWDADKKVVAFHLTGGIGEIVNKWMKFMELETVDYRIESEWFEKRWTNFKDSTAIYNFDFEVILTAVLSDEIAVNPIEMQKEAFKVFAEAVGIEVSTTMEFQDYWELKIVDTNAISVDQNQFWKRTEYEAYIYYENIDIRRITDLLSRKLRTFVRPIPYDSDKYNIKMPYSNDFFDLKYEMIEHGFELTEMAKEIEVLVIRL